MIGRLHTTGDGAAVAMHAAASSLPLPPVAGQIAVVPATWANRGGTVPEIDVEIWSSGTLTLTNAELLGGVLHPLVVADDDFTATHGTEVFTAASHGLQTGDGPVRLTNSGGALPAGLSTGTDYWIIKIDANTFYLAASLEDALENTKVTITDNGTGTHTLSDVATTSRVHWHSYGNLGNNGTGSISLTDQRGYTARVEHRPQVVAYAVTGTLSAGSVSARVVPVERV